MLVGDIISQARAMIPDPAPTMGTPAVPTVAQVAAIGSTLPTGTYFVKITAVTLWGETLPSAESASVVIGANQGIQVTFVLPPGATKIRVYYGIGTGGENQTADSA